MNTLFKKLARFFLADDGPTAVEYAVMLSLILAVCVAGIAFVGAATNTAFQNAGSLFQSNISGGSGGSVAASGGASSSSTSSTSSSSTSRRSSKKSGKSSRKKSKRSGG